MTQLSSLFPGIGVRRAAPGSAHKWDSLYGIELELENVRENDGSVRNIPSGWDIHDDASLRNGLEFVLARPVGGERLEETIAEFYSKEYTFTAGARTSTHIHVNMSDATVEELRSMIVLVYAIEDAIYMCAEESRKWGGYSVALAEMRPARLRNILNAPSPHVFSSNVMPARNNERYYGLNCNISRHGTVEFRYFPGGPTQEELVSWVDLVALIKQASQKFTVQALNNMINSPSNLAAFLTENFGYWAEKLLAARSAEDMMGNLDTVLAMALDDENPERVGSIVYVTPALLKFLEVTALRDNKVGMDYLLKSIPKDRVLSSQDWQYYLGQARDMGYGNSGEDNPWDMSPDDPDEEEDGDYEEPTVSRTRMNDIFSINPFLSMHQADDVPAPQPMESYTVYMARRTRELADRERELNEQVAEEAQAIIARSPTTTITGRLNRNVGSPSFTFSSPYDDLSSPF